MAISVEDRGSAGIVLKKGLTDRLFLTGISGGVSSDGSEAWTISIAGAAAQIKAQAGTLLRGMPLSVAVSGVNVPTKSSVYVLGWDISTKAGDVGTLSVKVGINAGEDVEFVDGSAKTYTQSIEPFEEDASVLEVDSYWKSTAGEDKSKRAGYWASAVLLSSLIMNGNSVQRFPEWASFTKDLTGIKYSTYPEFLRVLPKDLMSRLQSGLTTMRVGGLTATFSETKKGTFSDEPYDIGAEEKPPSGKLRYPKNLSWRVLSDSISYSSATGESTRTTVYKGTTSSEDD